MCQKRKNIVNAGSEGILKELCFGSMTFRVYGYIHMVGGRKKRVFEEPVCFLTSSRSFCYLVINYYVVCMIEND